VSSAWHTHITGTKYQNTAILLHAFFWVILRHLNFICRRFGTPCSIFIPIRLWRWDSAPKRRHIKFRCRRITQKKAYNIQDMAKVWNLKNTAILCLPVLCGINNHCNEGYTYLDQHVGLVLKISLRMAPRCRNM